MNQTGGQFEVSAGPSADVPEGDLYALLGLPPFEPNVATISARARDLMRDARKYQVGPRADEAHVRIEKLAAASACLLDPLHKLAYDNVLRERFGLPPVSIRSNYSPSEMASVAPRATKSDLPPSRSPRLTLLVIGLLVIVAIALGRIWLQPRVSLAPSTGEDEQIVARGPFHPAEGDAPIPASRPIEAPPAESAQPAVDWKDVLKKPQPSAPKPTLPASSPQVADGTVRDNVDNSKAASDASADDFALPPDEGPVPPPSNPPNGTKNGPKVAAVTPADAPRTRNAIPPPLLPAGPATLRALPNEPPPPELQLSETEVLRQLRDFRLKRSPAMRMSVSPQMIGAQRAVDLVRYARSKFPEDRRFQKQLDQEVVALRRLYPPFRAVFPDPEP